MVIAEIDPNPQKAGAVTRWTKAYSEALHPFNPGGGYVNFMMDDEGDARVKATMATTTIASPRSRGNTIRPTCSA
jgi:hypothetical protein